VAKSTQFVGIDLHQDTVTVAVLPEQGDHPLHVETLKNEPSRLRTFFERLSRQGPLRACYEASGCGFVLQRHLERWDVPCEVVAPSLIPQRTGDRIKTDRRDAVKLASLYRAGLLTPVHIPSEGEERTRSLVRCREALTREILSSRHYVLKLLQTRGQRFQDGKNWTHAFWSWLKQVRLEGEDILSLGIYVELLESKLALRARVDASLERIAKEKAWCDTVGRLRCLRGVDTLTALTLAVEIGDARRFASPRQLMAYVGLNVSEYSSGGSQRRGGITKAGNSRCRRVLVEAAWHYRHKPNASKALMERQEGQSEDVRLHAMRAQRRLHRRFETLELRMPSVKAVTAVARELVGFVWALMRGEKALLAARAPR
jgi:transposase